MADSAVLITGGAKRLGRHLALYLAAQGYDVALHYHQSQDEAHKVQAEIQALGRQCVLVQGDVTQADACAQLVREAKDALPHLDGLINNASIFVEGGLRDASAEQVQQLLSVHVMAPFLLMQSFAAMVGRGAVVNMLDTFITKHSSSYFAYLLSKKALADMVPMAAKELGPDIRVNAVAPGPVLPLGEKFGEEFLARRAQHVPLQRLGTPDAVADAVHYLLRSDYVTGQTLYVDGGEHLG